MVWLYKAATFRVVEIKPTIKSQKLQFLFVPLEALAPKVSKPSHSLFKCAA